jgi:EpsG family
MVNVMVDILAYVVPVVFLVLSIRYIERQNKRHVTLQELIICGLPLILLASLRGIVGTDTASYLTQFEVRLTGGEPVYGLFEPGFEILVSLLLTITGSSKATVNLISFFNALLFLIVLRYWGRSAFASACVMLPAFFFDYTMNGLRIGMAFPLAVFAVLYFENRRPLHTTLLLVAAVSIHYTAVLVFFCLIAPNFLRITSLLKFTSLLKITVLFLTLAILAYFSLDMVFERIIDKTTFYELQLKPNEGSGSAAVAFSVILLLLAIKSAHLKQQWSSVVHAVLLFSLQLLAFQLTQVTYAGIRFQLLFLFCQMLIFQKNSMPFFRHSLMNSLSLLMICVVLTSWKINSFVKEDADIESRFLPYTTFWMN